jgi:hypothetical protein
MLGTTHLLPRYAFMEWCSVKKKKHRDNFTFTFTALPGVEPRSSRPYPAHDIVTNQQLLNDNVPTLKVFLLLSLAPQPSLGLGLLHKIRMNFLEASQQFSFLHGRVVSPTPNPHPGEPGLCIYIPQGLGGYPF